jgi:AcrR family transcriptional regulator
MTQESQPQKRSYVLRRRAEAQAETRRRITEAAIELHDAVGPARTTIADVARLAGVQRLTVYKHFPDERALFEACTTHWFAGHPPPDPAAWTAIDDVEERIVTALGQLYAYYRENRQMFTHWLRDAELIPVLNEFAEAGYHGYLAACAEALTSGWPREFDCTDDTKSLLMVALQFHTWRLLADREQLAEGRIAELMAATVLRTLDPQQREVMSDV